MNRIILAAQFAEKAHRGQTRQSGVPYISHVIRVAGRVGTLPGVTEDMVVAAWLHDVVEDTDITLYDIERLFDHNVASLVHQLTSQYTKKNYPNMNRAERKRLEHDRLAQVSHAAKTIKLVDRIDNLADMAGFDEGFLKLYLTESKHLLYCIEGGPDAYGKCELEQELLELINRKGVK